MARLAIAAAFGIVVGMVAGAALGIRASDESASSEPTDDTPEVDIATPEPAYGIWDRLAQCESSGRWAINSGNGYFGGLQQDLVFWRRYGGTAYAPRPDLASRAAQIAVAQTGLNVQGWGAWPRCSRILGLR